MRPPGPLKGRFFATERWPGACPITNSLSVARPLTIGRASAIYPCNWHWWQARIHCCKCANGVGLVNWFFNVPIVFYLRCHCRCAIFSCEMTISPFVENERGSLILLG